MATEIIERSSPAETTIHSVRRFEFDRDTFAFANELVWQYFFDPITGKTTYAQRVPKPDYAHRCFVLACAARRFLYHARFEPDQPRAAEDMYRALIRRVISRHPRVPCERHNQVVFPGFASLRQFSRTHEQLLKEECGGAWRSYVLRSHWRMVFPIWRAHQARTARSLVRAIHRGESPIIHLVLFPKLSINHGMVLFGVREAEAALHFAAYDPNAPARPTNLTYDHSERSFSLPANHYWAGGKLDVIEIYRNWFI